MEAIPITELSIGLAAVAAIIWIVKAFLNHLTKKDEAFTNTINNHLHEDTEIKAKLAVSHENLTKAIERVLDKN